MGKSHSGEDNDIEFTNKRQNGIKKLWEVIVVCHSWKRKESHIGKLHK